MKRPVQITRADSTSLWHAIDAFEAQTRALPTVVFRDGTTPSADYIEHERALLLAAKKAWRKVEVLRKAGPDSGSLLFGFQVPPKAKGSDS